MNLGSNLNSSKNFIKEYYPVLSDDYPSFLDDYIKTKEIQHLAKSSFNCGLNYTNLFDIKFLYSNLDHSIGVALIIWNFTHDKKQTLAGLFHDIAAPTFKHCIDFMNGDYEEQESTEEKTESIIRESKEIMQLLKRDNITVEEIMDYKIYPIADNSTPKLSADRLEYTLANGVCWKSVWDISEIKKIYDDLIIVKNEDDIDEIAFNSLEIAELFIEKASLLWPTWIDSKDKLGMQFIADSVAAMEKEGYITIDDLYTLSELEVVERILKCPNKYIADSFKKFMEATNVYESDILIKNKYCKSIKSKKRYINPLVKTENGCKRITELSDIANELIKNFQKYETAKYAYLDFDIPKAN